ncbi:MAG: DUF1003 domain-containing protein [Bacteroidota bacterium]
MLHKIKNVNKHHKDALSRSQRFASWITGKIGTMTFFYVIFSWTASWLLWNTLGPKKMQFDPAPDFLLWLFISNMIQIFLMPLIMIGQNLQGKHAEILADNDFEVNKKAEQEIKELREKLDYLTSLIEERLPPVK